MSTSHLIRTFCLAAAACAPLLAPNHLAAADPAVIPHAQDRPPGPALSPEQAIARMTVPDGFVVDLVASEPQVVNPVAMTFDDRGRIWVTESLEYPRADAGEGRDRIRILEDLDGDGRVDEVKIFAEGLNIPSGIAVGYGGVWVANAPDILFMRDSDGDDRCDQTEIVVTGFGREDTHEVPNSLTWGPDGWLYGLNGVFNNSHVRYPASSPHADPEHPGFRFTAAMFRIHPRTREFQVFAEGTSNPWGIAWDSLGSAFVSACVIDHLWHITETGYYHRQAGAYPPHTWKIESIVGHKHQKAAYCGIEFFESDAYPETFRRRLYMGNIHGNCVNVDTLERRGATYIGQPADDFLTANDAWFMPVAQKTAPDGCLYVLDWYDRYHCYQDAMRDAPGIDRLHGRIYRIRHSSTPLEVVTDLQAQSDDQLIDHLSRTNVNVRRAAQRILQERASPQARSRLAALVLDASVAQRTRLHALWSLLANVPLPAEFHEKLLADEDPAIRAWAVRAAGNQGVVHEALARRIAALAEDPSADVRLQVAIAARKIQGLEAGDVLLRIIASSNGDPLIPHIAWQNLHPIAGDLGDRLADGMRRYRLAESTAFHAVAPRLVDRLLEVPENGPRTASELVVALSGSLPVAAEPLAESFVRLARRTQSGELAGPSLETARGQLRQTLIDLLSADAVGPLRHAAILLAATWQEPLGLRAAAQQFLHGTDPAERLSLLDALIASRDPAVLELVLDVLKHPQQHPMAFRGDVIASLGRLDDPAAAKFMLDCYPELEPQLKPRVVELLTQRDVWAESLLAAVARKEIPPEAINLNQVRRLLAAGGGRFGEMVRRHWGTVRDERRPDREEIMSGIVRLLRQKNGDPSAGAQVFEKVCAQCHSMHGQGTDVGPDITVNGRSSFEQLLSNVFDPSLVIGSAYQAYQVLTTDGRVLTGLLVEDSPQRVVLKMQGGKTETLARSDVELLRKSEVSLMPEDLEKQISEQELVDLFAYITLDRPPADPDARKLPGTP